MADFVFSDKGDLQLKNKKSNERQPTSTFIPSKLQCLLSDLEVILNLESSKSKDEGWSLCSQSEFCEVWKKRCEHESTHLVKVQPLCSLANAWNTCSTFFFQGYLHLPGITPDDSKRLWDWLRGRGFRSSVVKR